MFKIKAPILPVVSIAAGGHKKHKKYRMIIYFNCFNIVRLAASIVLLFDNGSGHFVTVKYINRFIFLKSGQFISLPAIVFVKV